MIGTESKLWDNLQNAAKGTSCNMTRIETSTCNGVSDVEYVTSNWHGWIELKTSSAQRETSLLNLHTPYTSAQLQWLLDHHDVERHLRSWLVIGRVGVRTWREYLLIPPRESVICMQFRKVSRVIDVQQKHGVIRCATAHDVIAALQV
jgi:hypothetical protein